MLKRLGRRLLEALTAPEVVELEKKLAIKIALKLAASAGSGAGVLELVQRLS